MLLKKTALALVAQLLLISFVAAQHTDSPTAKLPETEAGRRVADYIKAFNSGDEQLMRAFILANVAPVALERRPADARLDIYRQMRARMETIEARRVSEAASNRITVLFETRKGEWVEIGFEFEADAPHKLLGLRVEDVEGPRPGATSANTSTLAPLTQPQALMKVEDYLKKLAADDRFSGTVLLAKDGRPVFERAYGLASREYNIPNRMDTKFNLGSINKLFTQIAVGQLVEQGKLSFDDHLGKYLPDYPNREAREKVTVRQLLDMASGIGDFFGPAFAATPKDKLRAVKDFLPLFASEPLLFEPGTKQQYSNGGYIVLGAIIEKATGQDYYDYVREHVFKRAGMQDTDWYEVDVPTPNLANGYTREGAAGKNGLRSNVYLQPAKGSPAGGGHSTALDLLKFAIALQGGKLRLPAFRKPAELAASPAPTAEPPGFTGIGMAGGAPGINAMVIVGPADGYVIIVLSNYDPPAAETVGKQIREWLRAVKS